MNRGLLVGLLVAIVVISIGTYYFVPQANFGEDSELTGRATGEVSSGATVGSPSGDVPVPKNFEAYEALTSSNYTGVSYSPYAERDFADKVLWGDSHLHTGLSMDAGAFGNRLSPSDAYQFARGEEVISSGGLSIRLSRPLDWLAVTDHSDNMGFITDLIAGEPELLKDPVGKDWYDKIQAGEGERVAYEIIDSFGSGNFPESIAYTPDKEAFADTWQIHLDAAEEYNEPGRFSTIMGFEWTSLINGNNMHRVVLYRDGPEVASQMVPYTTTAPHGSINPRDLWKWLDNYEKETGGDILAIAHNGNLANGIMFPDEAQYDGTVLDAEYVTERSKWEPLYEVTQIKGDGEAHPFLSPDDEFADYETWELGNLASVPVPKTNDMLAGEYAREALKRGLLLEETLGTNPYKFGMIGATDSHTALATAQEDNFFGKTSASEPNPERMTHPFMQNDQDTIWGWGQVASGLAGVWAKENTREAIFDAMERKETYATTGSRMAVRFFGGWDYDDGDLVGREPAFAGYNKGVPMGGDLIRGGGEAPTFMTYAIKDPIGGNLDRIQIIKGWLDESGGTHERVYDVAVSGGRLINAQGRTEVPVGNTVDAETASFTNTIGASELGAVWTDPDFNPDFKAFYYVRVIEIPTPRWSTIDAFRFGIEIPEGAPVSTQERAYTSPIWYNP